MAEPFLPGERVSSAEYGAGTVKTVTANGAFVTVHFDAIGGLERVHASELRSSASASSTTPPSGVDGNPARGTAGVVATMIPPPPSRPAVTTPAARDDRRLSVECLRQGLPPPGRIASWTVGARDTRGKIDAAIRRAASGRGTTLLVQAGYGKGKSHLGRLARELALEARFATLHIELDGEGVTLRTGARWLSLLFASLLLPKVGTEEEARVAGLGQLLRRVAAKASSAAGDLGIFERFLANADDWANSEDAILVLEGYLSGDLNATESNRRFSELLRTQIRLPSIGVASKTMEERRQAQCEQLARVVRLARLCGASGGLVVVDELDHDLQYGDGRSVALLRHLTDVVENEPMVVMLLAKDDSELEVSGVKALQIDALDSSELASLVEKTCDAFASAFPSPALERGRLELVKSLEKRYRKEYDPRGWGPRFFVRAAIEACEVVRVRGLASLADVKV